MKASTAAAQGELHRGGLREDSDLHTAINFLLGAAVFQATSLPFLHGALITSY